MTILQYLQQVPALFSIEFAQPPVVQDENLSTRTCIE